MVNKKIIFGFEIGLVVSFMYLLQKWKLYAQTTSNILGFLLLLAAMIGIFISLDNLLSGSPEGKKGKSVKKDKFDMSKD